MTDSLCAQRLERLRRRLRQAGADALLVVHRPHVFYLTGFTGDAGILLLGTEQAWLFTDGRFAFQVGQELVAVVEPVVVRGPLLRAVGRHLRNQPLRRVAVETAHLSVSQYEQLQQATGHRVRWLKAQGWIEAMRRLKDAAEIARIRQAAAVVDRVFEEVLPLLRPGVREVDVAAEVEYRMRRHGAQGPAFETIVAAGRHAALPHARPRAQALEANQLVVLDMGAILGHYCSDLTRTVYLGRAPMRIRQWYRAVRQAQQAALEALRPGVAAGAVDRAARQVLHRHGLEKLFVHSTGHGIGLEIHEEPRLGRGQRMLLRPGMVVTVEPGIYEPQTGGIRIEDDVLVTERGAELLTAAPRTFLEL